MNKRIIVKYRFQSGFLEISVSEFFPGQQPVQQCPLDAFCYFPARTSEATGFTLPQVVTELATVFLPAGDPGNDIG